MIEVSRKNAQEKKRKREQELQAESTQKTSQKAVRFSEATAEDGARSSKRIQEEIGFAFAYSGNDDVIDINEEDLDDLQEEIEHISDQIDSQFSRAMNDDGFYDYD